MNQKAELELLNEKISSLKNHGVPPTFEMLERVFSLANQVLPNHCHFETVRSLIDARVNRKEYLDAINLLQSQLEKFPDNIDLQRYYLNFQKVLAMQAELAGLLDPSSFQFRSLYETAVEAGQATLTSHLSMVEHYVSSGEIPKALALRKVLLEIVPNAKLTAIRQENA